MHAAMHNVAPALGRPIASLHGDRTPARAEECHILHEPMSDTSLPLFCGAQGHGGNIRPAFSSNWPALKGANVGIVTLQLEPNATHLPHWHRGFELLFVINVSLIFLRTNVS